MLISNFICLVVGQSEVERAAVSPAGARYCPSRAGSCRGLRSHFQSIRRARAGFYSIYSPLTFFHRSI